MSNYVPLLVHCQYKMLHKPYIENTGIKIGQRQVSEYQEGGMPFGLGYGLALVILQLKRDKNMVT